MAERVFIALGQKPRFLMLPSNFLQTGFRAIFQRMNEDLVFDVAEGLKILDYQPRPFKLEFPDMCQRRRKNASIFRNKNTSVKLARRAGNLGPFPRGSGLRPFIRRGVGTGAA